MSSETYHEPLELLPETTKDLHRAIVSLMEELEAIDWYQQRVDATGDHELRSVLGHNRDEEIEHAMMNLEWIRRNNPKFDEHMRTYLFTKSPITRIEAAADAGADKAGGGGGEKSDKAKGGAGREGDGKERPPSPGSLGIGGLR